MQWSLFRIIFFILLSFPHLLFAQSDSSKNKSITLPGVLIRSRNYQSDSIARRLYYQDILTSSAPKLVGTGTPSGFGIVLSPITYFSLQARRERQLRKRIELREREAFIDYVFPLQSVRTLSKLSPDSFQLFYYKYRPTYKKARKMNRTELPLNIQNLLKDFRGN